MCEWLKKTTTKVLTHSTQIVLEDWTNERTDGRTDRWVDNHTAGRSVGPTKRHTYPILHTLFMMPLTKPFYVSFAPSSTYLSVSLLSSSSSVYRFGLSPFRLRVFSFLLFISHVHKTNNKKKHLNERPTVRSYIYRQLTIKTWSTNTAYEYDVRLRLTAP